MNRDQVDMYKKLQEWSPQLVRRPKPCGEYTKSEAIDILTLLLKDAWGSRLRTSTLRWEEELLAVCSSLDGVADESVCMKYSMIPAIIRALGPQHYRNCLLEWGYDADSVIDSDHRNILWFFERMRFLRDGNFSIAGSSHVLIRIRDIHSRTIEYKVNLPQWMQAIVNGKLMTMSDVDTLCEKWHSRATD